MCKLTTASGEELDLVDALLDMGLRTTQAEAGQAMEALYPSGTAGVDLTTILVEVFSLIEEKRRRRIFEDLPPGN